MRKLSLLFLVWISLPSGIAHALTVDEIIKLKRAGVSDLTIELLITRGGDARSAGTWKRDGWIVHTTEGRFPDAARFESYNDGYPIAVYPQFFGRRHLRPK